MQTIVVTGASDGIGAAAARQLRARGHQVVLVGRSRVKTETVARELGAPFHLADFAQLSDVAPSLKAPPMAYVGLRKPPNGPVAEALKVGQTVPRSPALAATERIRLVAFLRHVGCPFAENTVRCLRVWANALPEVAVIAVGHGDSVTTPGWIAAIGGLGCVRWVSDDERALYRAWGLGYARMWHFSNPASLAGLFRLMARGIHLRRAAGTRFQRSGMFLVEGERLVWADVPESAQELNFPPEQSDAKHTP